MEQHRQHYVPPLMVKEMFCFICNSLGLIPKLENPGMEMRDDSNEALGAIGQTILAVQILLRDFFKKHFTSRAPEIARDYQAVAKDMCNKIVREWPDGTNMDKVYIVSALFMELYLFCGSVEIPVSDKDFPEIWQDMLSELFGHTIMLRGGYFPRGNPISTDYYRDYQVLSGYIFHLPVPYQSVSVNQIRQVQPSYHYLNTSMERVFGKTDFSKVQNLGYKTLKDIHPYIGRSTSEEGPSTSEEGPSTSEEGPSTSGEGPSTSGEGPSTSGEGPSTSGEGPSTSGERPSKSRVGGPSTEAFLGIPSTSETGVQPTEALAEGLSTKAVTEGQSTSHVRDPTETLAEGLSTSREIQSTASLEEGNRRRVRTRSYSGKMVFIAAEDHSLTESDQRSSTSEEYCE